MFAGIGLVILLAMVFGGFAITGGDLEPVFHAIPHEMLIIGGALRSHGRDRFIEHGDVLRIFESAAHANDAEACSFEGVGRQCRIALDSVCINDPRGRLGRVALLSSRLAVTGDRSLEHVHADCHRRVRGLFFQRGSAFSA